jgi:hypothetical protein
LFSCLISILINIGFCKKSILNLSTLLLIDSLKIFNSDSHLISCANIILYLFFNINDEDKLDKDESNNAIVNATVYLENASHNIIRTEGKKLVVIDGLKDYIIVDKENVLFIYPKSKEQDIKKIVGKLNL